MITNVSNNKNQVQFGALKLNKPFSEWNTDVLNATLNSRVIRSIIAKDAREGKDTFLTLQQVKAGVKDKEMNMMALNVKGAGKDLLFKAQTFTEYIKSGLFGMGEIESVTTGSKNMGQDIAEQIKSLDVETFSRQRAIDEIKDIAGRIEVTEKEVGMNFEA